MLIYERTARDIDLGSGQCAGVVRGYEGGDMGQCDRSTKQRLLLNTGPDVIFEGETI